MDLETLDRLRRAAGVTIEEIAHLIGCSHFTYKKMRKGDVRIDDWGIGLARADKLLTLGFRTRVLPTIDPARREQILEMLLQNQDLPMAEMRPILAKALQIAMEY